MYERSIIHTVILILFIIYFQICSLQQCYAFVTNFREAKYILYSEIYYDHPQTLYCGTTFNPISRKIVLKNSDFPWDTERAYRVEVEHIVPAENFGRAFSEWREGAPQCVKAQTGKPFKGRKCAETNPEYQRMESDLHNLAPAIGAVNAARKNYRFGIVPAFVEAVFRESCDVKIYNRTVEPPDSVKGLVARTHLYFGETYPKRFRLSRQQQQLFEAWDKMYVPNGNANVRDALPEYRATATSSLLQGANKRHTVFAISAVPHGQVPLPAPGVPHIPKKIAHILLLLPEQGLPYRLG